MKKILLLIAVPFILHFAAFSQSCLPEGITFTTQEQIDNFQSDYPGCTEIEGDVEIKGDGITNLNGLIELIAIYGDLWIRQNDGLSTLTGLENLATIGEGLFLESNSAIVNFTGLNGLTSLEGNLTLWDNGAITNFIGLESLFSVGGLSVLNNISVINFAGLNNLQCIKGYVNIKYNNNLTNFAGLENLTSIEDYLWIQYNDVLSSLRGLDNITSIRGFLAISFNPELTSLINLVNLKSIDGDLHIMKNDALINLTGLENIDSNSIVDLFIRLNDHLSSCELASICNYLLIPNGVLEIHSNAPGCNSPEEVEEACETISVEENNSKSPISIYPNPAKKELFVSANAGMGVLKINIYMQTGQNVLSQGFCTEAIDISMLKPGMYIIEVSADDFMIREKLVVK